MQPHSGHDEKPEIGENLPHQRSAWVIQRIALCSSCLILTAALLGAFGHGGFNGQHIISADGSLTVQYGRFLHRESPESLKLTIRASGGDSVQVWIADSYLDAVKLEQISPEPSGVRYEQNRVIYRFPSPETNTLLRIQFRFQPDHIGNLRAAVGVGAEAQVQFKQFVYP